MDKKSGSFGIGSIVFIVLLILKLTGNTDMSWLMVLTSPIWVGIVSFIVLVLLMGMILLFGLIMSFFRG
jgi:hypothetical protein